MDELRTRRIAPLATYGLVLLFFCPALMAVCATSSVPVPRAIASHKELPALAFRQYSVNLREIPATGRITVPFSFWNRSNKPLEIVKLEPSCGCLAPRLLGDRTHYVQGGQGLFEVKVDTAREAPGPHTYSVRVHYNDGTPREELVVFRMSVPERNVQVTPPELYFYQLTDTAITSEIRVADHRGKNLKVVEVKTTSPFLTAEAQEPQLSGDVTTTPIRVSTKGNLPGGAQTGIISIRTDDADFPVIQVPVFLQGKPQGVQLTAGEHPATQGNSKQNNSAKANAKKTAEHSGKEETGEKQVAPK